MENVKSFDRGDEEKRYGDDDRDDNQCSRLKEYLTKRRIDFREKVDGNSVTIEIGNAQSNTRQNQ